MYVDVENEVSGSALSYIKRKAKSAIDVTTGSIRKVVKAPGEVAEALSTTAKGVGKGISSSAGAVPVVLIVAAVGVAGYLLFMGKAGKKVTPTISGNYPELLGRCGGRSRRRRR